METEEAPLEWQVSNGVPQGSIVAPTLWNLMYDGVLPLPLPGEVSIVGYADDLALVAVANSEHQVINNTYAKENIPNSSLL